MLTPKQRFQELRNGSGVLSHARVMRGGLKAKPPREWHSGTDWVPAKAKDSALLFNFSITAGGKGTTWIELRIPSEDFPALIALMSAANREAALKAMAEELRYRICEEP